MMELCAAPAILPSLRTGFALAAIANVVPAIGIWFKMTISVRDAGHRQVETFNQKSLKKIIPMP